MTPTTELASLTAQIAALRGKKAHPDTDAATWDRLEREIEALCERAWWLEWQGDNYRSVP